MNNMMEPLPGWIRFLNTQTGNTIDLNPNEASHKPLLAFYQKSRIWKQITPSK
jgi:hypothetical protein